MNSQLKWKSLGSSIAIFILFFILLPILVAFLVLKLISGVLGLILAGIAQVILTLFIRYVYIFRIGYIHAWFLKKIQKGPHSRLGRTDVTTDQGYFLSIHSIPCLADNYTYLIINRGRSQMPTHLSGLLSGEDADKNSTHSIIKNDTLIDQNRLVKSETPSKSPPSIKPSRFLNCSDSSNTSHLKAAIVDVGDADSALEAISSISYLHYGGRPIEIESILTTHHHWDHQAGNRGIVKAIPGIKVYGGWRDNVDCCTHTVEHGNLISIGKGVEVEVMESPCHTHGSLIYRIHGFGGVDCLFTGDTLFLGGCGAPFEQSRATMYNNFWQLERHCHPSSLVFPGHEYTRRILSELLSSYECPTVPSEYFALCSALYRAMHLRSLPTPAPTVPYRLGEEMKYNPNFRAARQAAVQLRKACRLTLMSSNTKRRKIHVDTSQCSINAQNQQLEEKKTLPTDMLEKKQKPEICFSESPSVQQAFSDNEDGNSSSSGSEVKDYYINDSAECLSKESDDIIIQGKSQLVTTEVPSVPIPVVSSLLSLKGNIIRHHDMLSRSNTSIGHHDASHFYEPLIGVAAGVDRAKYTMRLPRTRRSSSESGTVATKGRLDARIETTSNFTPVTSALCRVGGIDCPHTTYSSSPTSKSVMRVNSRPVKSDNKTLSSNPFESNVTDFDTHTLSVCEEVQEYIPLGSSDLFHQRHICEYPIADTHSILSASSVGIKSIKDTPSLPVQEAFDFHSTGRPIGTHRANHRRKRVSDPPWITAPVGCGSPFLVIWRQEIVELESMLKYCSPKVATLAALERIRSFLDDKYLEKTKSAGAVKSPQSTLVPDITKTQQFKLEGCAISTREQQLEGHIRSPRSIISLAPSVQSSKFVESLSSHSALSLSGGPVIIPKPFCGDVETSIDVVPASDALLFVQESQQHATPPDSFQHTQTPRKKKTVSERTNQNTEDDMFNFPNSRKIFASLQILISPDHLGREDDKYLKTRSGNSSLKLKPPQYRIESCWKSKNSPSIFRDDFIALLCETGRQPFSPYIASQCWFELTRRYVQSHNTLFSSVNISTASAIALPLQFIAEELTVKTQKRQSLYERLLSCCRLGFMLKRNNQTSKGSSLQKPKSQAPVEMTELRFPDEKLVQPQPPVKKRRKRHNFSETKGRKDTNSSEAFIEGHDYTRCKICQCQPVIILRHEDKET